MQIEMMYDRAPDQIAVPSELRGKHIRAVFSDAFAVRVSSYRSFGDFLLTIPVDENHPDDLFLREDGLERGTSNQGLTT